MSRTQETSDQPLKGKKVVSTISTGGGGGIFQARVAALYLANMLTGIETAFGLHGRRVEMLRMEARYTGVHTDDIYSVLRDNNGLQTQLIQCKRGLDFVPSNKEFVDALQGIWRDFLGIESSPFDRSCDFLILATVAPGTPATRAGKRLCELSRGSIDLTEFLQKLNSKLFDAQHKRTWEAFNAVSKDALGEGYSEGIVFSLLQRLRVDIHDLGVDTSQELSLVQALLDSGHPRDSGEQVWNGLLAYMSEQGVNVGTITCETWRATAQMGLQQAVDRLMGARGLANVAERLSREADLQLSLISTKLPNGIHVPRGECAAQILSGFEEHQAVIVTGGPGVGKSAIIAGLAPVLRESGSLFFFRVDELDQPSLSAVFDDIPDALLNLEKLLANGTSTVVIDSLEKGLEARNSGALEELLTLIRRNKMARLCVTARSYALNPLFVNFLYSFSIQVINVPFLTDKEIIEAVAKTPLESVVLKDDRVREVFRAPFYIQLALNYILAGIPLPQVSANDLRLALWRERVAPSKGLLPGLAARRGAVFDEVCYMRTERFSQFVEAPADAEAVASLLHDDVLTQDSVNRVAPAHDVLEDWSLFFRVEREIRKSERDWEALFRKLGSHAGMRRALRGWTALRAGEGDEDAYILLESALKEDLAIPQLWRDEIAIGLLRSEKFEKLIVKLSGNVSFENARLLQRLSHLLRVACKGPTSIDYSSIIDDQEFKEIRLRLNMAAPVGSAWDVVVGLLAKAFPILPPETHSWVLQLAEDSISHDKNWQKPSRRVLDVFDIAECFCRQDIRPWYGKRTVGERFFILLCRCAGAAPDRFETFIEELLERVATSSNRRDFCAEERLQILVDINYCREACFFAPNLVWGVFKALYVNNESGMQREPEKRISEEIFGLNIRAVMAFPSPSPLQGPFRTLLIYAFSESLIHIVDLCNHAARSLAKVSGSEVIIIPPEQSPNGRPHIHSYSLWSAYRGLSVTSHLLNAALMALEERLLIEARVQPKLISEALEAILQRGESSFTSGLIAGVLIAYPELFTENLLSLFKCPHFFSADIARSFNEPSLLAIYGGRDGLASVWQATSLNIADNILSTWFLDCSFNRLSFVRRSTKF